MSEFSNFQKKYARPALKSQRHTGKLTRPKIHRRCVPWILSRLRAGHEPTVAEVVEGSLEGIYPDPIGARRCVSDALGQGHAKKPENEGLKLHFSRGKILACKENVALAMRPWENAPLTAETVAKEGGFESLKALTDFGESLPDAPPEPTPAAKPVSKTATPPTGEAQSDEEEIAEIDDLCDSVAGRGVPLNDVIARKSLRTEEQADEHV